MKVLASALLGGLLFVSSFLNANVGDDLMKITKRERDLSFQTFTYDRARQKLKREMDQIDLDIAENQSLQGDQKKDFFSMLGGLTELRGGQWSQIFTKRKSVAHMELDLAISKRAIKKAGTILSETRATAFMAEQKKRTLQQKNQKLFALQRSLADAQKELARQSEHKREIFQELRAQKIVQTPVFLLAKGKLMTPVNRVKKDSNGGELFLEASSGSPVYAVFDGKVEAVENIAPWNQVLVIDHGDNYHSVYMNLEGVTVPVGETVKAQTKVANVAEYALNKKKGIFFEIRHFGIEEPIHDWLMN